MERCYFDHLAEYGDIRSCIKLVRDTRLPLDDLRKYIEEHPLGIEKINVFFDDMEERETARQELIEKNIASVSSSLENKH